MANLDKSAKKYITWIPTLAIIFFVAIVAVYAIPRIGFPITTNPDDWGTFGDFLGGTLNPILSVLTILTVTFTVWLQMETLEVQRKELKASNEELAKSTEALAIQNKTMLAQNFEGTFFQMLRRHNELLENIKYRPSISSGPLYDSRQGSEAVETILSVIRKKKDYLNTYLKVYDIDNPTLGPYFRNLYHLLKLIDKNQYLTDSDKADYASLARAQLSSSELSLIFYNCLTDYGQGLKPLVIKYRLLKHIDGNQLCDPNLVNDTSLYPPETYQARN